jgi:hypothetical protein
LKLNLRNYPYQREVWSYFSGLLVRIQQPEESSFLGYQSPAGVKGVIIFRKT